MTKSVENVSVAIDNWLRQEVVESRNGRNKSLDDFATTREGFANRASAKAVMDSQKNGGHYGRYNALLSLVDEPTLKGADFVVGKLIHHSLMFVSGGFRLESVLKAKTQAEYEQLRFGRLDTPNGATSTPIHENVQAILDNDVPSIEVYLDMNHELNKGIRDNNTAIYTWFMDNQDRLHDALSGEDEPIEAMQYTQRSGLTLAVSHIAVASSLRGGDLTLVPFLEPKSITDVSSTPIYPIAA